MMDELKSKFLDFIHLQGHAKIPVVGEKLFDPNYHLLSDTSENSANLNQEYAKEDLESCNEKILETIDKEYFDGSNEFDPSRYELLKFEDMTDVPKIEETLEKLKGQQSVVSNNVLDMIRLFEKQSGEEEFKRVIDVQLQIDDILGNVKNCRSKLEIATRHFTTASLGILACYRRRALVKLILRYLNKLRNLYQMETRVNQLLEMEDFPGAIELLLQCQIEADSFQEFSCVTALIEKLQATLAMTEKDLDVALNKICFEFDKDVYKKLQTAYNLLGKSELAMNLLHSHFTTAIHSTASNVVQSFRNDQANSSSKMQYAQICKDIPKENLIPCLTNLCKSLWRIILSYYQVVRWHQDNPQIVEGDIKFESNYNEQFVKLKLSNGLTRIWHDVQSKVSSLVLTASLFEFKIEDFLEVLGILHRLSQIGDELCGSDSEELANSIRTQSSHYFKQFHASKLDELKVFLENESWTPCPVRSDFSVLHLQEFRGLRCSLKELAGVSSPRHNSSIDNSSVGANFFSRFPDPKIATPFDTNFHIDSKDEDILTLPDDHPSGYSTEESEDENDPSHSVGNERGRKSSSSYKKDRGPLLANTTLSVLRLCGKYLQMSRLLKSISVEVVQALTQLYDYYMYTVYVFFASDIPNVFCPNVSSLKLQAVINRVKDNLFQQSGGEECEQRIFEAEISPIVDLGNPANIFGLKERIIAVESLVFLSNQFTFIKLYLEQLLNDESASLHQLRQFYAQTVSVTLDLRKPVYACVGWRVIDIQRTLNMMSKVDWVIEEVKSEHSKYVDFLIGEMLNFKKSLCHIESSLNISEATLAALWDNVVLLFSRIFVEGFSSAKKCAVGGRSLMLLDFTQLCTKLDKICPLSPLPYKDFVDEYVRAFYLREEDLENFIKERKGYSSKHLSALVQCTYQLNKKSRQRLILLIEELEKYGDR